MRNAPSATQKHKLQAKKLDPLLLATVKITQSGYDHVRDCGLVSRSAHYQAKSQTILQKDKKSLIVGFDANSADFLVAHSLLT